MTTGFEFDWLKDLEEAEPNEVNGEPNPVPDPPEQVHYTSEAAGAFNDPDRYEEGMYPLPFTDWHPAQQTYEPESEPATERDPYEYDNDAPAVSGDVENFINDVGEFINDPIGSIFKGLFG